VLVSPTEPPLLRALGKVSLVPESYGCDFLFASPIFGLVGVQRKEIKDFVASVQDGRLAKELGQMKQLGLSLLVLEGRPTWTNDGLLTSTSTQWTVHQHLGTLWSVQLSGCWIASSQELTGTSTLISAFMRWTAKQRHTGLENRVGPLSDEWGKVGSREWGIHLLQGFKGIGPVQAAAILDHFGGLPLQWTVDGLDLQQVDGIGKKRAESLIDALGGEVTVDFIDLTGDDNGSREGT
jgi:ERCC4-type nuclease